MSDDHSINLSDDDDEYENGFHTAELSGILSKWTNYIHGWQYRYIVLKGGTLSYYKSENDTTYGCRGAISIHKAAVKPHEFDECRFDVSVNDCIWYLRAETAEERHRWVETLETYKAESGYGSENNLRRHGSSISLASASLSGTSTSSFKKGRGLREKLAEMETFRDILCRQTDTLQSYFDACAESVAAISQENSVMHVEDDLDEYAGPLNNTITHEHKPVLEKGNFMKELLLQHGAHAIDFKGEAFTFKATTAGILATLSHCIELMSQREESWKRRLEKEIERKKKLEEMYKQVINEAQQRRTIVLGGPDFEEGPHSAINEEEFFDAVDASLDKMDNEEEKRQLNRLKMKQPVKTHASLTQHTLWPEINHVTMEQLKYAKMCVGEGGWNLFAEEGEMKMYKREVEEGGMVVDPLKAVHTVTGITGHEMCHHFFDPENRLEWENTIESMRVLEIIADNTMLFHQIHKRVWPATQRDSLFWSHIFRVPNEEDQDAHDIWAVCNNSTEYPDSPITKCVRIKLTVILMCQTFIDPPQEDKEITRDNLTCKVTYCASVNPGGWAPASVLRAVYKREYPKFLKRFTQFVKEQTENQPIMF
uniref:Ceramide transfer protein n=1 Tax=Hemiscolopendra marginata TaxID=943146 RepID=A0A646QCI9_9MYRI